MVIGYDAKRAYCNKTGLGNYSRKLITSLAEAHPEDRFFLYSPTFEGDYKTEFSGYGNISSRQPRGLDRKTPGLWRSHGVSLHLLGDRVQLFHGLSHELPHAIPHSIRKVVTMHDLIVWRHPEYYKPFDVMVHRIKQRHACRVADVVVAISEQTKKDLIKFLHVPEQKIRVIYQSCDDIFWRPIDEEAKRDCREKYDLPEKYILCVGSVEPRKNQAAVVKALGELPEDISLVLVGRTHGLYHAEVQHAIRSLSLSNRVRIIDDADFEDFPALYANAVASAYMSHFEGFGIPILESMCCDTPVLTSNLSSMPEAGGEAALYADPKNPHDIAEKLKHIVSDQALRERMIAKGRTQREKFKGDEIADQYYNLYSSLIKKTKQHG